MPEPPASPPPSETPGSAQPPDDDHDERLRGHIVSPAPTTERLQAIQRLVADQTGEALPDFEANVLQAIPVQAGGLYPISDVWYIEPGLDAPDRLRDMHALPDRPSASRRSTTASASFAT